MFTFEDMANAAEEGVEFLRTCLVQFFTSHGHHGAQDERRSQERGPSVRLVEKENLKDEGNNDICNHSQSQQYKS